MRSGSCSVDGGKDGDRLSRTLARHAHRPDLGPGLAGYEAFELQDQRPENTTRRAGRPGEEEEEDLEDDSSDELDGESRDEGPGRPSSETRLSSSTVASFQLYTPDEERAVVRKFDRRLVAFLALCYMVSFLDRSSASSLCSSSSCRGR